VLDDDFAFAETNPCETFGNPYLTSHTDPFPVAEVELWGFGGEGVPLKSQGGQEGSSRAREHLCMMGYESS
jgi:hypothetical protein